MENHQPPFPVEDEIGTFALRVSYYLSIDPYMFINAMRLSSVTPTSVNSKEGLGFVFNWHDESNILRITRNGDTILKQEFSGAGWSAFIAAGYVTGYSPNANQAAGMVMTDPSESLIKEGVKTYRFHTLMKKLEKTKTPEEAYDMIIKFLGDDYEQEGSVTYKAVRIKYHIGFTAHNEELIINLEVNDKQDRNEDPILLFKTRVKRESIHRIYESVKRLVEMFQ